MHPAAPSRVSTVLSAVCLATLGEAAAIALFLIMFGLWAGIGSGRI